MWQIQTSVELCELFICYYYMLIDFEIISIFQNFSQICSSIDTRSGIGTLTLTKALKKISSNALRLRVYLKTMLLVFYFKPRKKM